MKTYRGCRTKGGALVTVDRLPLDPRHDLYDHSPDGFEWGYGGSGAGQLALAILADHLNDEQEALGLYQHFKFEVIADLPHDEWTLTSLDVEHALISIRLTSDAERSNS